RILADADLRLRRLLDSRLSLCPGSTAQPDPSHRRRGAISLRRALGSVVLWSVETAPRPLRQLRIERFPADPVIKPDFDRRREKVRLVERADGDIHMVRPRSPAIADQRPASPAEQPFEAG